MTMSWTNLVRCAVPAGAALALLAGCASAPAAPAAETFPPPATRADPPPPAALRPFQLPPAEEFTLPNGLRVVVVSQRTIPIITARVIVDAGATYEPADRSGLAVLAGSLLAEGTATMSGPELAERMARIGAQFQTGAGQSLGFAAVTALREVFPEALRLAAGAVMQPAFPQADFDRVRSQAVAAYRQSQATVEGLASEAFSRAIFAADAPYGRPAGGTATTLAAITRDDVVNWHRTMYAPAGTVLLLVGDLSVDDARALATEAFGGWTGEGRQRTVVANPTVPVERTRVILIDRPGSVQSAIRIGEASIGAEDPDFFRVSALAHVLGGGFNSRINQNLRETRGWTYGAGAAFTPLRGAGTFQIASSVRSNATDSALVESVREYRRMVDEAIPGDELRASLGNLVGSFPASIATVQGLAQRMQTVVLYGLPLDYYATYREQFSGLTSEQVREAARTRLRPGALTIVVAGDLASIEAPIRAANLGTVEVWSAEMQRVR